MFAPVSCLQPPSDVVNKLSFILHEPKICVCPEPDDELLEEVLEEVLELPEEELDDELEVEELEEDEEPPDEDDPPWFVVL